MYSTHARTLSHAHRHIFCVCLHHLLYIFYVLSINSVRYQNKSIFLFVFFRQFVNILAIKYSDIYIFLKMYISEYMYIYKMYISFIYHLSQTHIHVFYITRQIFGQGQFLVANKRHIKKICKASSTLKKKSKPIF